MIKLRYPNITGIRPEDRQKQMESFVRYLVDTLNVILGSEKKVEEQKQEVPTAAPASAPSAVKENTKAIKANAAAIQANSKSIGENAAAIQTASAAVAESMWFSRFVLDGDQTVTTANTYQNVKMKHKYGLGDFWTLSSDGKSITITKDVIATVSAQLYYSTAHSASGALRAQVVVSGESLTRGAAMAVSASAYTTIPMVSCTKQFSAGDVITVQAYSAKAGGLIAAYDFYAYLNIDVKGIAKE